MKRLVLVTTFIMFMSLAMAQSKNVVTGVLWNESYSSKSECHKIQNITRACYNLDLPKEQKIGNYFPGECIKGTSDANGSISTVIICEPQKMEVDPKCLEIKKKFMSGSEVCHIPKAKWNETKQCYAQDQRDIRRNECASGCDNVPKYHVCDWTQSQYDNFKNCTSVKFLIQQTRNLICPKGMADVDPTSGPPPRINIFKDRAPHFPNYLTFRSTGSAAFEIEISSISGSNIKICHKKDSTDPCNEDEYLGVSEDFQPGSAKYIYKIPAVQLTEGQHVFMVKNTTTDKVAGVQFDITQKETFKLPDSIPFSSATWIELIGHELTPIMKMTGNPPRSSGEYSGKTCNVQNIYKEEKDISGRRWKCLPGSFEGGVYRYMSFGADQSSAACSQEVRCSSYGKKYAIKVCSGGMDPSDNTGKSWIPFVLEGQYIYYYPEGKNDCDPTE